MQKKQIRIKQDEKYRYSYKAPSKQLDIWIWNSGERFWLDI